MCVLAILSSASQKSLLTETVSQKHLRYCVNTDGRAVEAHLCKMFNIKYIISTLLFNSSCSFDYFETFYQVCVYENASFGLFILPPRCEAQLLMSPSARCCQMAIYPPSLLTLISLSFTLLLLPNCGF